MGEQADSVNFRAKGKQLVEELINGLDPAEAWTGGAEDSPGFDQESVWVGWGLVGLVAAGTVLMIRAAWVWWHLQGLLNHWPELARFARGKGNRQQAGAEFRMLELVAGFRAPESWGATSAWNQLTPSEQVVAWGTMQNRSVKDLAHELACTPSHIYNLRFSIRKKWQLESEELLSQAIHTRCSELQQHHRND